MYGGGSTTLGLVVTSAHARRAGVQNALADLLIKRVASAAGEGWMAVMYVHQSTCSRHDPRIVAKSL